MASRGRTHSKEARRRTSCGLANYRQAQCVSTASVLNPTTMLHSFPGQQILVYLVLPAQTKEIGHPNGSHDLVPVAVRWERCMNAVLETTAMLTRAPSLDATWDVYVYAGI